MPDHKRRPDLFLLDVIVDDDVLHDDEHHQTRHQRVREPPVDIHDTADDDQSADHGPDVDHDHDVDDDHPTADNDVDLDDHHHVDHDDDDNHDHDDDHDHDDHHDPGTDHDVRRRRRHAWGRARLPSGHANRRFDTARCADVIKRGERVIERSGTGPADPLTHKLRGFGTTIFAEMSALAVATNSINLGQGFPDTDGPREVLDAAVEAIRSGHNQYPPGPGIPELRQAIARHQQRFYGLEHDPDAEVLVTAGATEALAGALLGMLDGGDEVIVFEPMYDSYQACIALAGARAVPVLLSPEASGGRYGFDADELRGAVTPRTRMILLNTPHNPTGKVFDADELTIIADVAIEHDLVVVTDEVYEHLVFPGAVHIPMATLPGMSERTLTISSGGKTFNTTGWKVGWACGSQPLVTATRTAKQFLTYVNGAPFQPAIAVGLDLGDHFYAAIAADLTAKRDHLVAGLESAGFTTYVPEATYFTTVDIRPVGLDGSGMEFCRMLPQRCGVVAIPNEVFYVRPEHGRHLVRFACCKHLDVLDEAAKRLASLLRSPATQAVAGRSVAAAPSLASEVDG